MTLALVTDPDTDLAFTAKLSLPLVRCKEKMLLMSRPTAKRRSEGKKAINWTFSDSVWVIFQLLTVHHTGVKIIFQHCSYHTSGNPGGV